MSNETGKAFVSGATVGATGGAVIALGVSLLTEGFGFKSAGIEQGRQEVEKKYDDPAVLWTKIETVQKKIQENIKVQQEQVIKMQQNLIKLQKVLTPTACVSKNTGGLKLKLQTQHTYQMS